jgi:hypothetical protein
VWTECTILQRYSKWYVLLPLRFIWLNLYDCPHIRRREQTPFEVSPLDTDVINTTFETKIYRELQSPTRIYDVTIQSETSEPRARVSLQIHALTRRMTPSRLSSHPSEWRADFLETIKHSSGDQTLASHRGASGSVLADVTRHSWWTECTGTDFFQSFIGFLVLIIIPPLLHTHLSPALRYAIAFNRQHFLTCMSDCRRCLDS